MARTRRPLARGTRRSSGIESGVTFGTNPSGTTIDNQGITTGTGLISTTELNYLNGAVGYTVGNSAAANLLVSGVSYWAGATVTLVTGLTAISSIVGGIVNDSVGSSALLVAFSNVNNNPGCASASIRYNIDDAGSSIASLDVAPGCSIAFVAFGT